MTRLEVRTQTELDAALETAPADSVIVCVGNAWFEARGSAHVEARGSAHVEAWGSAHVVASRYVSVHQHSDQTSIAGGVVIEIPPITTVAAWCEYYGAPPIIDGVVILYKAVSDAYLSGHDFAYVPGTTPEAPDWDGGTTECGGGLHFCASPCDALWFFREATKFVACPVRVEDLVVHHPATYPSKVKARRVSAPIIEVDRTGQPILV